MKILDKIIVRVVKTMLFVGFAVFLFLTVSLVRCGVGKRLPVELSYENVVFESGWLHGRWDGRFTLTFRSNVELVSLAGQIDRWLAIEGSVSGKRRKDEVFFSGFIIDDKGMSVNLPDASYCFPVADSSGGYVYFAELTLNMCEKKGGSHHEITSEEFLRTLRGEDTLLVRMWGRKYMTDIMYNSKPFAFPVGAFVEARERGAKPKPK